MAGDVVFHVPVDAETSAEAVRVLEEAGISPEELMRRLLTRVAREKRLPLVPNQETLDAIAAVERGEVVRFDSVEALMADLNRDDDEDG